MEQMGPTDAAGGIITSDTYDEMVEKGIKPEELLRNNDSYHALKKTDRLIMDRSNGNECQRCYLCFDEVSGFPNKIPALAGIYSIGNGAGRSGV